MTALPSWDLPVIELDTSTTRDELINLYHNCKDYRDNNWLDILSMCVDSQIYDTSLNLIPIKKNLFNYINSIASHNTCIWLYNRTIVDDDDDVSMDEL